MKIVKSQIAYLLLLLAALSCNKDPLTDFSKNISVIKVFQDTMADPNNASLHMVAGNGRLFMTYGKGNVNGYFFSGVPNPIHNWFMVTDNEGVLIRREALPAGLSIGDMLALEDGSVILAAFNEDFSAPLNKNVNLFHYDKNGLPISQVSFELPATIGYENFSNLGATGPIQLIPSANKGNIIVFGRCLPPFPPGYPDFGFIAECDLQGTILWSKKISLPLSCGIATPDNGYLFAAVTPDMPCINLIKINAVGDSLWSKKFITKTAYPYLREIIRTNKGNYQFCFNAADYPPAPVPFSLYEVNTNVDSLNAIEIGPTGQSSAAAILPLDDGSTFVLMNDPSFNVVYAEGVFDQINTRFAIVDSKFNLLELHNFQTETTDLFSAACKTSDGRIACFGIIQCSNRKYYKPELIILNSKLDAR